MRATILTPKKTLTVENLLPAIAAKRGNLAAVARAFGVARQSVHGFVAAHPELQKAVAEAREVMLDVAEDMLQQAVRKGEGWAVCFYLKTQGRRRGYVQQVELDAAEPRYRPRQQPAD